MHKRLYIILIIVAFTAVVLQIVTIYLSNQLASNSIAVKNLQNSIANLNEENQILKSKLLTETSFETIASKAAVLGFSDGSKYISLRKIQLSYSQ